MLESNNKKIYNVIITICLIIFTIIAVVVTYFAIVYTNNRNKLQLENDIVKQNIIETQKVNVSLDEKELAVKLTDTYDNNPIKITEYLYIDGKIQDDLDNNFDYTQYEKSGKFIQISGLKNKTVQSDINKEIKNEIIKLINQGKHSYCRVNANFANVLSVSIYNDDDNKTISFNYRLDTGKKIHFEDLFTDKNYIKTILTQSLYEEIVERDVIDNNPVEDAFQSDYSVIEEECLKIVQSYLKNPDVEFYFNPGIIIVTINDYSFRIKMENYANYIAIYKRYAGTKNLYENNENFKGLYVFSNRKTEDCYYSKLQKETDNLFVDIWLFENSESTEENKQKTLNSVNKILEQVKTETQNNLDKGYIFTAYLHAGDTEMSDVYKYVMSREYYDESGPELIAKCNREAILEDLGVYYDDGHENKNISPEKYYKGKFMAYNEYLENLRQEE